jgi:hypothetical protein
VSNAIEAMLVVVAEDGKQLKVRIHAVVPQQRQ